MMTEIKDFDKYLQELKNKYSGDEFIHIVNERLHCYNYRSQATEFFWNLCKHYDVRIIKNEVDFEGNFRTLPVEYKDMIFDQVAESEYPFELEFNTEYFRKINLVYREEYQYKDSDFEYFYNKLKKKYPTPDDAAIDELNDHINGIKEYALPYQRDDYRDVLRNIAITIGDGKGDSCDDISDPCDVNQITSYRKSIQTRYEDLTRAEVSRLIDRLIESDKYRCYLVHFIRPKRNSLWSNVVLEFTYNPSCIPMTNFYWQHRLPHIFKKTLLTRKIIDELNEAIQSIQSLWHHEQKMLFLFDLINEFDFIECNGKILKKLNMCEKKFYSKMITDEEFPFYLKLHGELHWDNLFIEHVEKTCEVCEQYR